MVNAEDAADAAEVRACEVESDGLALDIVALAERQRLGRVEAGAAVLLRELLLGYNPLLTFF